MKYRFNADEWAQPSAKEQVRRSHLMAEEARKLSLRAPPILKKRYVSLAKEWETLATEIEDAAKSTDVD